MMGTDMNKGRKSEMLQSIEENGQKRNVFSPFGGDGGNSMKRWIPDGTPSTFDKSTVTLTTFNGLWAVWGLQANGRYDATVLQGTRELEEGDESTRDKSIFIRAAGSQDGNSRNRMSSSNESIWRWVA